MNYYIIYIEVERDSAQTHTLLIYQNGEVELNLTTIIEILSLDPLSSDDLTIAYAISFDVYSSLQKLTAS